MPGKKKQRHLVNRIGWLRAAVLGADDGIVSTAALILGIAASGRASHEILVAGVAALVAGSMSMAAGEYVSVRSQYDTEQADLAREKEEIQEQPEAEQRELAAIYVKRGLEPGLAKTVAAQLMAKGALEAHARDELGISEATRPRPIQAAVASALSFASGAILPIAAVLLAPRAVLITAVALVSVLSLAILGGVGARVGGARIAPGVLRVSLWGAAALGVTAGVGALFGANG